MQGIKNKLPTFLALFLFPVFILGVFVSDFVWARLVKHDRKSGILQLFESPKHSAQAGGSATSSGCFPAKTLVAVAGIFGRYVTRKIENIRAGDRVLVMDFPSGKLRRLAVAQPIRWDSPDHPFMEITFEGGMKIVSTSIHPFVVNEKNETRKAWQLRPGDSVLVLGGEKRWEKVIELKSFASQEPVYNLELDGGPHNYFVSVDGLKFALVHNAKLDGSDSTSDSASTASTGSGGGCFRTGTFVATKALPSGEFEAKPIESVRVGEEVLSMELSLGTPKIVSRKVVKTSSHPEDGWLSVEFETESGAKITATDNHPMVVDAANTGIAAGDVAVGAKLFVASSPSRWERVIMARKFIDNATVYNIELEDEPHNYFASLDGKDFILAHNATKM